MPTSNARRPFFSTIRSKVLAGLLVAALLPLIASILISLSQIDRMNTQSISTGSAALSNNAKQALQTQAQDIALTTGQKLNLIGQTTQELANYAATLFSHPEVYGQGVYPQDQTMVQLANGQWGNSGDSKVDPSSAFISNKVTRLTTTLRQILDIQTYLDPVFQAHFDQDQFPTYIGTTSQITRYYPNINLAQVVPPDFDITQRPWFVAANPDNDPQGLPVYSALYADATGNGLTITSAVPIYVNGKFVGVVGRDVPLEKSLLQDVLPTKIGTNGYTFLVSQDGKVLNIDNAIGKRDFGIDYKLQPDSVLQDFPLDAQHDPAITSFTQGLAVSQPGVASLTLDGQVKYLAYAPIQAQGTKWAVVLVQPESEVLAPIASLDSQLTQQITQTKWINFGLTAGLLLLAGIVAYILSRNIARPLLAITRSAEYLATGQSMYQDPEVSLQQERMVQRGDEVGQLARAFEAIDRYFEETSQLADQIAQGNLGIAVQRTSDQDRLGVALENMMSYLSQILQVVTRLASGDLSQDIQPRSNSDVLGNALKYMLDELSALVVRVQSAGREIESAATFVLQRSALLVEASERQMEQIMHATSEASQMAESNHKVAEDTYKLAHVAYNSRIQAQAGFQAVQQAIMGMNQIQDDVREATQRVSQLNRRTQEITRITEVISNIAHQTNRLALDAAIHAQTAGPHGRNFSMVAGNIRHLAEQVKEEVNQISRLIQTIVEETSQAIQASKQSQQQVVEGVNLASSAGTALESIATVVDQQGQLVEVINRVAKQQKETSVSVAQEMQGASDITVQYSAGTRQTAQSIERLVYLARQLKESVEVFTLPGSYANADRFRRSSDLTGPQMPMPVRSVRPTPLLPQGHTSGKMGGLNGMNGGGMSNQR
ncbi:MAG TPA: methyl-accepting chemotaxis protein [Ktedonobacterales bacterium]